MQGREKKRFEECRLAFDSAIDGCYDRITQASEDMQFAYVAGAQWNHSDLKQYKNRPKFENNTTALSIQRIHGQYQRCEFSVNIIPNSDEATEEDAEILTSKYRDDFIKSDGVEADSNAALESFTCGFGASLWVNRYEDEENPDPDRQYLSSEPIYSAATSVFFSANSLRKDKSDSTHCWYLVRANREAIEKEYNKTISPYPAPVHDVNSTFDWSTDDTKDIYIAHVWEVCKRVKTDYVFEDGFVITVGDGIVDSEGNTVDRELFNELKELGDYEQIKRTVTEVEYSLQHGDGYLIKPQKTPFNQIPIVPRYGYYIVINGQEYWWGEVAHKRDPQRFDNMLYSALGQIAGQNQIALKEYLPAQINKHTKLHAEKNVNNPPFLVSDVATTSNGQEVVGPVADHQPPPIGSGLASAIQINQSYKTQQEGTGQSTLPSNASAQAVQQVNERQDDRYQSLFQNQMFSIQAGARVYIPACQEIYFSTPRNIRLLGRDGSFSMVDTMQNATSEVDNTYGANKYTAPGKYEIQVKMDEAYKDKKRKEFEEAMSMLQYVDTQTEKGQLLMNQAILTTTSESSKDLRKLARYETIDILLARQIPFKPDNEEESQYIQMKLQQMQQQQQQSNQAEQAMIAQAQAEAQARMMEGQAALQNEQNDAIKNQIAAKKLENDQAKLQIEAHKAGADINLKSAQTLKTQAEAAATLTKRAMNE